MIRNSSTVSDTLILLVTWITHSPQSMWELAQKWAARAETEHQPIAIARYLDACYLLDAQLLDDLIQKLTGDKIGILAESASAPAQLDVSSLELKVRDSCHP